MYNKYIIVDLSTMDYMKDESDKIKIYDTEEQARETCGMYEFENVWVCKLVYNYIDEQPIQAPNIVLCDSCNNCTAGVICKVKYKFKEENKSQSEFTTIIGGAVHECDYYEPITTNVAVISKNFRDFCRFKILQNPESIIHITPYCFMMNNIRYFCVSTKYHCIGLSVDTIIETEFAQKNPNYNEILNYIKPCITSK